MYVWNAQCQTQVKLHNKKILNQYVEQVRIKAIDEFKQKLLQATNLGGGEKIQFVLEKASSSVFH